MWFTALYYRIPAGYPAENEQSVYLSTIMSSAADGWKLEWNDSARARLEESFHNAGFSAEGYAAMEQGHAWAKFFIPFDLYTTMLYYDNAVMCKLVEMYLDENNDLNLTFYASNGMGQDVALTGMDLTVTDENRPLFAESFSLDRLVQAGNTVVVIEHNLDVIKTADYIIDLGPEGGDRGGEIVCCGTPEQVAEDPRSYTGKYLAKMLTPAARDQVKTRR